MYSAWTASRHSCLLYLGGRIRLGVMKWAPACYANEGRREPVCWCQSSTNEDESQHLVPCKPVHVDQCKGLGQDVVQPVRQVTRLSGALFLPHVLRQCTARRYLEASKWQASGKVWNMTWSSAPRWSCHETLHSWGRRSSCQPLEECSAAACLHHTCSPQAT